MLPHSIQSKTAIGLAIVVSVLMGVALASQRTVDRFVATADNVVRQINLDRDFPAHARPG